MFGKQFVGSAGASPGRSRRLDLWFPFLSPALATPGSSSSLDLPFYYPAGGPSLPADRGTVTEEAIEEPIEEPEVVTAEPTSVYQGAEEFSTDFSGAPDFANASDFGDAPDFADVPGPTEDPMEVPSEIPVELSEEPELEPSSSSRGRERSPYRQVRPPKARPRPSQALRPLYCVLPAHVESYGFANGTLVPGQGIRRPPIGSPCLFLDFHNTLNRTRARSNTPQGSPIPEQITTFLRDLKRQAPSLLIFVLSFLVQVNRRRLLQQSIRCTTGADSIFAGVLTCAAKAGSGGKAATVRSIADTACAAIVDDTADVCCESHRDGIKTFHIWIPERESGL